MNRIVTVILSIIVLGASVAFANLPPLDMCEYHSRAEPEQVSLFCTPDGQGHRLDACYGHGGHEVDATVEFTLLDWSSNPIVDFPREDIWLESSLGGMITCPGGAIADQNTDAEGRGTFSGAFQAGGSTDPIAGETLLLVINGSVCPNGMGMDIQVNSADMNGDLAVDLTDVVIFATVFYGPYDHAADFHFDGVINLSDVVLMMQGRGANCP